MQEACVFWCEFWKFGLLGALLLVSTYNFHISITSLFAFPRLFDYLAPYAIFLEELVGMRFFFDLRSRRCKEFIYHYELFFTELAVSSQFLNRLVHIDTLLVNIPVQSNRVFLHLSCRIDYNISIFILLWNVFTLVRALLLNRKEVFCFVN